MQHTIFYTSIPYRISLILFELFNIIFSSSLSTDNLISLHFHLRISFYPPTIILPHQIPFVYLKWASVRWAFFVYMPDETCISMGAACLSSLKDDSVAILNRMINEAESLGALDCAFCIDGKTLDWACASIVHQWFMW